MVKCTCNGRMKVVQQHKTSKLMRFVAFQFQSKQQTNYDSCFGQENTSNKNIHIVVSHLERVHIKLWSTMKLNDFTSFYALSLIQNDTNIPIFFQDLHAKMASKLIQKKNATAN